ESTDEFRRYVGATDRASLKRALSTADGMIFRDSRSQLWVRDEASGEQTALDNVGTLFVYSSRDSFRRVLVENGFAQGMHDLVNSGPHWRHCIVGAEQQRDAFVRELALQVLGEDGILRSSDGSVTH